MSTFEFRRFAPGEVVYLRSDGAPMTVRETLTGKPPKVRVDWHLENGEPITADYHPDQLCRVADLDRPPSEVEP